MIKDNQKRLNRFHVVLDAFVILASYWLAWFVIMVLSPKATVHNRQAMAEVYILAAVMIVPLYLILYAFFHLYTPKRVQEDGQSWEISSRPIPSVFWPLRWYCS